MNPATDVSPAPAVAAPAHRSDLRDLLPWYGVEFLNSYACTLLTAGCYDYAHDVLHASPSTELWLSAGWGFAYIFIALNAGKISERWGPRKSVLLMSAASVFTALNGLFSIAIPSVWMILAIMLPYNITSTTIWPAIESAITRTKGKTPLSTRMALFNLSWGSAGFVAFFTRGALEHASWSLLFIVPAAASLLSFLILWLFGPGAASLQKEHVHDSPAAEHELDDPAARKRAQVLLHMAWIGNALSYVAIYVLIPLLAKLADTAGVTSLVVAGIITSIWSFTRFAGFGLVWGWSGWHYKARWLIGAQLVLAATFLLTLTVHNPLMLIFMQILFGLATALIYSSALYYAMHVSSGHGGHAGFHEALIGMGICAGPTIGALAGTGELGPVAMQRIGFGVTTLLVIGGLIMVWMALRTRPAPAVK